ncbi:MAG TPA: Asp-tRNA(Asn)/Glu-tRNA(Gln) amidotransferase subunit GatC [Syntrophomonadaceae bacterium]|nr:Asp-tRNA(Asn)/Glu-tRNA(Gln) amidotransferase subunit GatC [Syntrophomonadaceae bacterium]
MKLTREEVRQVAVLARLALNEEEFNELYGKFNEVLEFVETINNIDTENVEPTYYLMPVQNVWRSDEAHQPLAPEDVFLDAPERDGSFFKVPRIL